MNDLQIQDMTNLFSLLSDPTRMKIISNLIESVEELCVSDIAARVGASHSATSHQLAKLEMKGIVKSQRRGQTICYKVTESELVKKIGKYIKLYKS